MFCFEIGVADKKLYGITDTKPLIRGTAFAVHFDMLGADPFAAQTFGKLGQDLLQESVESLTAVIFLNVKLFHFPYCCCIVRQHSFS